MSFLRRATGGGGSVLDSGLVAPVLSTAGLIVVGVLSAGLLAGRLPFLGGQGGGADGGDGPLRTPTPSNVVNVDPRANVPGALLYLKAGNVWVQSGTRAHQLTDGGSDSMPAFSPDGSWVYFVRTAPEPGTWRIDGQNREFKLSTPTLMRMRTDGTGGPEALLAGRIKSGTRTWSYFIRQPAISPDGSKAALITDGPDPTKKDVVLQLLDLATLQLTDLGAPETSPLGHQDPAWSSDGKALLYVQNGRDGTRGAPVIMRYDVATKASTPITGPGYTTPAWSPDGRFVAATRTTAFGTDVVILDARYGSELLRVTTDQRSFAPAWSPIGNAIAFFRIDRGVTDLWLAPIDTAGSPKAAGDRIQLTIAAGLAAGSRPGWWVPPDQIPTPPTATPAPTAVPSAGTPAASVAP